MKKILVLLIVTFLGKIGTAQNCSNPIVSCPDTVITAKDTLQAYLPAGFANGTWAVVSGPGVVANPTALNTSISGLAQGQKTVILYTYSTPSSGSGYAITTKTWLPATCPVCPAQKVPLSVSCGSGKCTLTYTDGTTTTF